MSKSEVRNLLEKKVPPPAALLRLAVPAKDSHPAPPCSLFLKDSTQFTKKAPLGRFSAPEGTSPNRKAPNTPAVKATLRWLCEFCNRKPRSKVLELIPKSFGNQPQHPNILSKLHQTFNNPSKMSSWRSWCGVWGGSGEVSGSFWEYFWGGLGVSWGALGTILAEQKSIKK